MADSTTCYPVLCFLSLINPWKNILKILKWLNTEDRDRQGALGCAFLWADRLWLPL